MNAVIYRPIHEDRDRCLRAPLEVYACGSCGRLVEETRWCRGEACRDVAEECCTDDEGGGE